MATRNGEYFRSGLIFGVLVGMLAALLFAPRSGRELRARLAAHLSAPPPGADSPPAPPTGDTTTQSRVL